MEDQQQATAPVEQKKEYTVINTDYGTITELREPRQDWLQRLNHTMVYEDQSFVNAEEGPYWREVHLANKMVIRGTGLTTKEAMQNSQRLYLQVKTQLTQELHLARIKLLRDELETIAETSDEVLKERLATMFKLPVWRDPYGHCSQDHPDLIEAIGMTWTLMPDKDLDTGGEA